MTVMEALRLGAGMLSGTSKPLDATILLEHVTNQDRSWLYAHGEATVEVNQASRYFDLIKQRRDRVPVAHLTGKIEFYGLELFIDNRALSPRVETEKMVEWATSDAPKNSCLLDIGTGSGALAIAIKKHRPDLEVIATDVSADALEVARENVERHKVEIELIKSDLWSNVSGQFETVVTNLPYLKDDAELMPEVKKEPAVALFGGVDGLDLYRHFLAKLPEHLTPGGRLYTECDPWQHQDLIKEAMQVGLKASTDKNDYFILGFTKS